MLFPESKVYDRQQQQQEIQYGFGMDDVLKILGLTLFFVALSLALLFDGEERPRGW